MKFNKFYLLYKDRQSTDNAPKVKALGRWVGVERKRDGLLEDVAVHQIHFAQ